MRAPENFFSTLFKMRISQHGRRVATAEAKAKQSQTPAAGTVGCGPCGLWRAGDGGKVKSGDFEGVTKLRGFPVRGTLPRIKLFKNFTYV